MLTKVLILNFMHSYKRFYYAQSSKRNAERDKVNIISALFCCCWCVFHICKLLIFPRYAYSLLLNNSKYYRSLPQQ